MFSKDEKTVSCTSCAEDRFAKGIVPALLIVFFLCGYSCDDNVDLGTPATDSTSSSSTSSSSSSGGGSTTEPPTDDDKDGLSNQVEETFKTDPRKADSDHDGVDDGLEFVGENGDPLDASRSPRPFTRRVTVAAPSTTTGDADQDGLSNNFEVDSELDENDPDLDGDGYSDSIELIGLSDPFLADDRPTRDAPPASDGISRTGAAPVDSDGDGLANDTEASLGSRSDVADSDSDGFADGIEYLMGSSLTDAFSVPNFTVPARSE